MERITLDKKCPGIIERCRVAIDACSLDNKHRFFRVSMDASPFRITPDIGHASYPSTVPARSTCV
jgi:hypothetical protein